MRIDIWSDIACPWCYIGKRRLEAALAGFEHRDEVEVVWRSFQLDPGSPAQPDASVSMAEHLGRKYGGGPGAGQQMIDRMEAVAAEEGLIYRLGRAQRVSTLDAHRLLHAAGDRQDALKEALLHSYMMDGDNIADHETLSRVAVSVGLDAQEVARVLSSDEHRDAVYADVDQAADYGISGVPFFVLDQKFAISGAQPVEVFSRALAQAWEAARPVLQMAGLSEDSQGEVCGPEGCTPT
ncbi:MAG: DsbA family oxidoreductase [Nocardioides sp.]